MDSVHCEFFGDQQATFRRTPPRWSWIGGAGGSPEAAIRALCWVWNLGRGKSANFSNFSLDHIFLRGYGNVCSPGLAVCWEHSLYGSEVSVVQRQLRETGWVSGPALPLSAPVSPDTGILPVSHSFIYAMSPML